MMLKRVGFYRELRHGDSKGETIHNQLDDDLGDNKELVIKYLSGGNILAASGVVGDFFNPTIKVGGLRILTDGVWVWPSDLSYYLQNYSTKLPQDFLLHVESNNWEIPLLSEEEIIALIPYS